MGAGDELINQVVNSGKIPSGKRRREIQRELRTHVEDFITAAREAGRGEDEIRDMIAASFGDPAQIADGFAWVYWRERATVRVGMFLISTLAVTSLMLSSILTLQAGLALGLGYSVFHVLAGPHAAIEALDILFTVMTYTGLAALEELFQRNRFFKALALVALAFAALTGVLTAANLRTPFLVFGVANGAFFRTIQVFVKSSMARTGLVAAGISVLASISLKDMPSHFPYVLTACASWLAMGTAYRKMPDAVARMDAALLQRLQRI